MSNPATGDLSIARRHFQAEVALCALLGCATFVTITVGAVIWRGGQIAAIRDSLDPVVVAILEPGLVMTPLATCLAWVLGHRWFGARISTADRVADTPPASSQVEGGFDPAGSHSSWRRLAKDPLTGLFSRDALLTFADDAVPYFRRYKRGVSILMVEIDRFQSITDTSGSAGADPMLRHVAEVLDLSVRKTDKVARFDAHRFIVLLREISEADTIALADRMRTAASDLAPRHRDRVIPVTVSIGAALVSDSDTASETLIERAETALLTAKKSGGNLVCFQAASAEPSLEDVA